MVPAKTLFIEDFCVDEACRGQHIGTTLFDFVKAEAKRLGCNDICLNVWEITLLRKSFMMRWVLNQNHRKWNIF